MNKQVLELSARKNFKCLGSECTRTCCQEWHIEVDSNTIHKWNAMKDSEEKEYLMNCTSVSEDGIYRINKTDEGFCVALDNNLCGLQMRYGEEWLPDTCRAFPRLESNNYYRIYYSASLACPAIVEDALFGIDGVKIFTASDQNDKNKSADQEPTEHEKILYSLDSLVADILERRKYDIGISLLYLSDTYVNIINMSQTGDLTYDYIEALRENLDVCLANISQDVKHGKLKPDTVISGSLWKIIYEVCIENNIDEKYLDSASSALIGQIMQCDDSPTHLNNVYMTIKKYRKKSKKQVQQRYAELFRRYIRIMFINKGFPLAPRHEHDFVLAECMIYICVVQFLMWIEVNKNGKLTDKFIGECIVEVDRKIISYNRVIALVKRNPSLVQIDKYCQSFLDLF